MTLRAGHRSAIGHGPRVRERAWHLGRVERYETDGLAWHARGRWRRWPTTIPTCCAAFRIAGLLTSGTDVFGAPGLVARLGEVLAEHPIARTEPVLGRAGWV